jgi:hypothetical protein
MKWTIEQIEKAKECILKSNRLIGEGRNEHVIRESFCSYLRLLFPESPSWVERHIEGGEALNIHEREGRERSGFVDNLVGNTVIEYESNLTIPAKFNEGRDQVQDYCAGLLNNGVPEDLIVGVLSDTVSWRAYSIEITQRLQSGVYGRDHITLHLKKQIDLLEPDESSAIALLSFLEKFLARIGSRPLDAQSITSDLGLSSIFYIQRIAKLRTVVENAFAENPEYAELIKELWEKFIGSYRIAESEESFNIKYYLDEIYVLIIAELICANLLNGQAIISNDEEISEIINGKYFKEMGLVNLIEYDYFGWIRKPPYIDSFSPIVKEIQLDLQAYDYINIPNEDLFGKLLCQLATENQRLLLGQEWTPQWLANYIVEAVISLLPQDEAPRLIDMCCGSGTFIIETIKCSISHKDQFEIPDEQESITSFLTEAIVGFDIDPLAVILSKINWVMIMKKLLGQFEFHEVMIPIFHADSLFAIPPLSHACDDEESESSIRINIGDKAMDLPLFLTRPDHIKLFDRIISTAYRFALLNEAQYHDVTNVLVYETVNTIIEEMSIFLTPIETTETIEFLRNLSDRIHILDQQGKNGIWAFLLRNGYRPALLAGQFNGIVSNPPWLTLSKIANNPNKDKLIEKSRQFDIYPPGSAFPHLEMATIFFLHSVDKYLQEDCPIGCILPETILTGIHHNPFKERKYLEASRPVQFSITEIYRFPTETFKNKGIVVFGKKKPPVNDIGADIPGRYVDELSTRPLTFRQHTLGRRIIWCDEIIEEFGVNEGRCANFVQGADIMPRTLIFHEVIPHHGRYFQVKPIDRNESPLSYLVKDAKKFKLFRLHECILPKEVFSPVLISKHLTPFDVAEPANALLPIRKSESDQWEHLTDAWIVAKGEALTQAFQSVSQALSGNQRDNGIGVIWDVINMMNKLSQQKLSQDKYLIISGTSGKRVCSTYLKPNEFDANRIIIDQTLNWVQVESEDEALYLIGCLNSETLQNRIQCFQPEGAFQQRHIHTIPYDATPKFQSANVGHRIVVAATRQLLSEYNQAKHTNERIMNLLNPNESSLAYKRKKIWDFIKLLPSYVSYNQACSEIFS